MPVNRGGFWSIEPELALTDPGARLKALVESMPEWVLTPERMIPLLDLDRSPGKEAEKRY